MLEAATLVTPLGRSRYATVLDPGWSVREALNGGYLEVPVVRAVLAESPHPHPVAVTADFLAAPRPGEAEVVVEAVRTGRTVAVHRAVLAQAGVPVLSTSVVTASLSPGAAAELVLAVPGAAPPPEECVRVPATLPGGGTVGLMDRVECRLTPDSAGILRGAPDGSLTLHGWVRLALHGADGSPLDGSAGTSVDPDPLVCLLGVDAFPPVTFTLGRYGWAPTVQLSTYLRALPEPGWLQAELRGGLLADGWFDEGCTLWDSAGRLVAQSRQLARAPR